ncbi:MAG: GtrA family protein [Thermoleophilia bacterium]|nr:GtrA family protein [Thermoleophilia bacterium]
MPLVLEAMGRVLRELLLPVSLHDRAYAGGAGLAPVSFRSAPRRRGLRRLTPIRSRPVAEPTHPAAARVRDALQRRRNWEQLLKFCAVGATGYGVNLLVYIGLLHLGGLHYVLAAVGSFLVAVTNNYTWNRFWTFSDRRGGRVVQGVRFLIVSTSALGANLMVLALLVAVGLAEVPAQAVAIVLVTPVNFVGNKLWSFGRR